MNTLKDELISLGYNPLQIRRMSLGVCKTKAEKRDLKIVKKKLKVS